MHFGIKDLIDVLLVAFFLYQTYRNYELRHIGYVQWSRIIHRRMNLDLAGIGDAVDEAILDKFISAGFVVW